MWPIMIQPQNGKWQGLGKLVKPPKPQFGSSAMALLLADFGSGSWSL